MKGKIIYVFGIFGHWILITESGAQCINVELYPCENPMFVMVWDLKILFVTLRLILLLDYLTFYELQREL